MKHPEYDSPFKLTFSDITTQIARNIDEMAWQAIQRVGINVDKDTLLAALKQDAERYREAYTKGYDTGYEQRDDDIVRCKDCERYYANGGACDQVLSDWFCADGKQKGTTIDE